MPEAPSASLDSSDDLHDPRNYFLGAGAVRAGKIPSFGFRREHLPGNVRLEDWAKNRGYDLRTLATKRNLA